jgi:hypothetical protein
MPLKLSINSSTCFLAVASAFMLTGCGNSEPSDADIQQAIVAADPSEKSAFKKHGCKEDGKNVYRCDVGLKSGEGTTLPMRLVKTDQGWRLSQQ